MKLNSWFFALNVCFSLCLVGEGGVYVIIDDRTLFARTLNYRNLFIKLQLCNRLMFKIKIIK